MVTRHYRRPGRTGTGVRRPEPADLRIRRSVQPSADHPDRVQAGPHLVHPHPPDALDRGDRGERHVGVLAVQDRTGLPSGPASRVPRNDLRLEPDQDRHARATRARAAAGAAPSCGRRSWRSRAPGRRRAGPRRHPRATAASSRWASSSRTSASTSSYDACCCISVGVGAPVHHDVRRPVLGHDLEDPRVGQAAGHVVDQHGTRLERGRGDLVAHRVDGDGDARRRPAPGSPARRGRAPPRPADGWRRGGWTHRRCRGCRHPRRAAQRRGRSRRRWSPQRPPSENESGVTLTTPITTRPRQAPADRRATTPGSTSSC